MTEQEVNNKLEQLIQSIEISMEKVIAKYDKLEVEAIINRIADLESLGVDKNVQSATYSEVIEALSLNINELEKKLTGLQQNYEYLQKKINENTNAFVGVQEFNEKNSELDNKLLALESLVKLYKIENVQSENEENKLEEALQNIEEKFKKLDITIAKNENLYKNFENLKIDFNNVKKRLVQFEEDFSRDTNTVRVKQSDIEKRIFNELKNDKYERYLKVFALIAVGSIVFLLFLLGDLSKKLGKTNSNLYALESKLRKINEDFYQYKEIQIIPKSQLPPPEVPVFKNDNEMIEYLVNNPNDQKIITKLVERMPNLVDIRIFNNSQVMSRNQFVKNLKQNKYKNYKVVSLGNNGINKNMITGITFEKNIH